MKTRKIVACAVLLNLLGARCNLACHRALRHKIVTHSPVCVKTCHKKTQCCSCKKQIGLSKEKKSILNYNIVVLSPDEGSVSTVWFPPGANYLRTNQNDLNQNDSEQVATPFLFHVQSASPSMQQSITTTTASTSIPEVNMSPGILLLGVFYAQKIFFQKYEKL